MLLLTRMLSSLAKMAAIKILILVFLIGSAVSPSKVHAGPSRSRDFDDSRDSKKAGETRDEDEKRSAETGPKRDASECKGESLDGTKQHPRCNCRAAGTVVPRAAIPLETTSYASTKSTKPTTNSATTKNFTAITSSTPTKSSSSTKSSIMTSSSTPTAKSTSTASSTPIKVSTPTTSFTPTTNSTLIKTSAPTASSTPTKSFTTTGSAARFPTSTTATLFQTTPGVPSPIIIKQREPVATTSGKFTPFLLGQDHDDKICLSAPPLIEQIKIKLETGPPTQCKCGDVSKIEILNPTGTTESSLEICTGCTGTTVAVENSAMCSTGPGLIQDLLKELCDIVLQNRCTLYKIYRCSCPATSTTETTASTTETAASSTVTIASTTETAASTTAEPDTF